MYTLAVLAVVALVATAPTAATIVDVTYTGFVRSGYDTTGVFSTGGADLTGFAYRSFYRFDTTLGLFNTNPDSERLDGGSVYGLESPMLAAQISINDITLKLSGDYQAHVATNIFNNRQFVFHFAEFLGEMDGVRTYTNLNETIARGLVGSLWPRHIDTPFAGILRPGLDSSSGAFVYRAWRIGTNDLIDDVYLNLTPQTYLVEVVPEPASWAMMIAGFGLLGAAARGRRATPNTMCGTETA